IPVPGIHQVYNALAAICAAELLKVDRSLMIESCQRVELPKMRMEMKEEKGITVINDAYNANPQSMKAALEVLKTLKVKGRRFFVCADMMELGDSAQTQHRHLGEIIPDYGVYCLVTFGENAELTSLACKSKGSAIVKHVYHATGKELISAYLLEMLQPGDAVLVKGSRAMCMDEVADALLRRLKNMQDHQTADDYTNVS
ncbi:MAG: cyanophycin synthetase, partial [Chlamydiota bacterium]|nr:cyanophycin synthetase [Chlamydiota bacterium]